MRPYFRPAQKGSNLIKDTGDRMAIEQPGLHSPGVTLRCEGFDYWRGYREQVEAAPVRTLVVRFGVLNFFETCVGGWCARRRLVSGDMS